MFNPYNLLENPYSRFFVYMKALDLAVNGKVIELIIPSLKKLDDFLKEWNLGVQEQRELFLSASNILKESKSSAKDSFKFLTKYLATFSGEDAHTMGEAKEEAVLSIIEFVKTPDKFQCNLLDMPAVAQLEKDAKYELAYQLLKIFLTQKLDAYLEFHSANSTWLKNYGLVHEDCIAKMRLMSLVDLGANESGHIPYNLIKDTLQISEDKVELWAAKAVTAKLIDCKLDQMNQVVIVSRCTDRVFGPHQWQSLRTKLATWRLWKSVSIYITEVKHQVKGVRSLKNKSLWSKSFEEVLEKLIDVCTFIHQNIFEAFRDNGVISTGKNPFNKPERLGVAGLALHYTHIRLITFPAFVHYEVKNELYNGLPVSMKKSLRSLLRTVDATEELGTIPQIKS